MFKNISVKKARIITAIICILIGIITCVWELSSIDNLFSFDAFLAIIIFAISLPIILYLAIDILIFIKRDALEKNISFAQSFLSTEEYTKINLKLDDNEFLKLSVEESAISYYAKITDSDREVEISIRKDGKEISNEIIDVFAFRRYFTA